MSSLFSIFFILFAMDQTFFKKTLTEAFFYGKIRLLSGALAQLGARHTGSVEVRGSNPLCSTSPEGRAAKYRGSSDKTVSLSHDSEFGFGVYAPTSRQCLHPIIECRQQTAKLHTTMAGFSFKTECSTNGKLPLPIIGGVRQYTELYTPDGRISVCRQIFFREQQIDLGL